jgi:hypothetical protein
MHWISWSGVCISCFAHLACVRYALTWGCMCSPICLVSKNSCSICMKLFIMIWHRGRRGPWIAYWVWWLGFGLWDGDNAFRFPAGTKYFSPLQCCHTGCGAYATFFKARSQNGKKRVLPLSCLSVRPSFRPVVCVEQLGSHRRNFMKFYIWVFFKSMLRKYKFH